MPIIESVDRSEMPEYPYKGEFWELDEPDGSVSLLDRVVEKRLAWSGQCDILRNETHDSGQTNSVAYNVYLPLGVNDACPIKRGALFSGDANGIDIDGEVLSFERSLLGGLAVRLKDFSE